MVMVSRRWCAGEWSGGVERRPGARAASRRSLGSIDDFPQRRSNRETACGEIADMARATSAPMEAVKGQTWR